jgi:hypothetical protein
MPLMINEKEILRRLQESIRNEVSCAACNLSLPSTYDGPTIKAGDGKVYPSFEEKRKQALREFDAIMNAPIDVAVRYGTVLGEIVSLMESLRDIHASGGAGATEFAMGEALRSHMPKKLLLVAPLFLFDIKDRVMKSDPVVKPALPNPASPKQSEPQKKIPLIPLSSNEQQSEEVDSGEVTLRERYSRLLQKHWEKEFEDSPLQSANDRDVHRVLTGDNTMQA